MTPTRHTKPGEAEQLYALLEDIDRAGHLHGTAARLDWLRLKTLGRPFGKGNAKVFYALLVKIHRLGLLIGTDADARWHLATTRKDGTCAKARTFVRCDAAFLFWRMWRLNRPAGLNRFALPYEDANGC